MKAGDGKEKRIQSCFLGFWPELLDKISEREMGAGTDLDKENKEFSFDHEIDQVKLHRLLDTYSKQCKRPLKYSPIKEQAL